MLDPYIELMVNQYHAALCMLNQCVDRCPVPAWNEPIHELAFCQAAFHVTFFTDLYLGQNIEAQKQQAFHQEHVDVFRDYEELEPVRQKNRYEQDWVKLYIAHCRDKSSQVLKNETEQSLQSPCGFPWYKITRGEMHVNNIRHVSHHAAQLSLMLRKNHDVDMGWFGSGWKE